MHSAAWPLPPTTSWRQPKRSLSRWQVPVVAVPVGTMLVAKQSPSQSALSLQVLPASAYGTMQRGLCMRPTGRTWPPLAAQSAASVDADAACADAGADAGVAPAARDGCVVGALLQAASSSADTATYIHRLDMWIFSLNRECAKHRDRCVSVACSGWVGSSSSVQDRAWTR